MSDMDSAAGRKALPGHCSQVGLVLQGGGALGAYQAGVFEALAEHGYAPRWIAGVSIGAINGAIIAGNPPEKRVERLKAFWDLVTDGVSVMPSLDGDIARGFFNEWSALASVTAGVRGFYRPRVPPALLQPWGTPAALSVYDTTPLRETLLQLVDFDLLNNNGIRLSVGAANIRKGNSVYFDTTERHISVDHVMASAALPPGFPPVEINGEHYWDGGVVSNTPLQYVLDAERHTSLLVFQVDLFSASGELPRNLLDVYERHKDILYSSRTRLNTDVAKREHRLQQSIERLLDKLPADFKGDPDVQFILQNAHRIAPMTVVHLIYRQKNYETQTKDYEFSRVSMQEHWQAGYKDTRRSLEHEREWLKAPEDLVGIRAFDMIRDFD
jgi:NTE family protein